MTDVGWVHVTRIPRVGVARIAVVLHLGSRVAGVPVVVVLGLGLGLWGTREKARVGGTGILPRVRGSRRLHGMVDVPRGVV